ncbi:MAG TPA: type II secretion system secretin GspD [Stellaceae bacterium]|nr:type II secretion system secretin GspD [Stellaceae bacterium]
MRFSPDADAPLAVASNAPTLLPSTPAPGRAVATMPANRLGANAVQPIVVHGNETQHAGTAANPAATGAAPADVTLNFAGADIRDVINAVLGQTLKLNYVIDPEVQGPITFNVSRPISRDEVLSTLEAVLNSRGATMVQVDGIIRVMPLRKENRAAAAAPLDRGPAAQAIGQRTEVFPLRFVGATDMQKLLEKVLPTGQPIAADDKHHTVLIQGTPSELQLAEDTVRVFDIDQLSGMSMALVPLRNAQPAAVVDELRNIFAATRQEADSDSIRFMAIARLNAVMVISRSGRYLDEARTWIARLDRTHDLTERRVYVYNLQYAKATQVGEKLQGLLSGLDVRFKSSPAAATGEGLGAAPGFGDSPKSDSPRPDSPKPAPPPPVAAPETLPASAASLAGDKSAPPEHGVRIEADETHNALLISANARDYELIRQVLAGIDVPPLQVLIEVTVAEVVLNDNLNYGVEYFINSGRTNTLLTTNHTATISPAVPGFNLSWVAGNFAPKAILDLLSSVTQTKVISTPRLLVLSNQTARLQVGDVVPIITQSATSTVTNNPSIVNNVTYKETGVVLEVTPRVNSGGYVTMDVNQSVSDVVNTTTSTIDSPTIRQRRLTSTVSVKSGESILLGGLIQQTDDRASSGIPILHDLPGIGPLFGSHVNGAGRTELIMLMTPHVIANDADSRSLTAKIEDQFRTVLDGSTLARPRVPTR